MGILKRIMYLLPDPIKWSDDLLAILRYGLGYKITWIAVSGWRGVDVETVLARYGVKVYWRDYGGGSDRRGLHVPRAQAGWADYLLRRAGAPLTSPALSAVADGAMPAAWGVPARPVGLAGAMVRMWAPLKSERRSASRPAAAAGHRRPARPRRPHRKRLR